MDLDDRPLKKAKCSELNDSNPLLSHPSPSVSESPLKTDYFISELSDFETHKQMNETTALLGDDKQPNQSQQIKVDQTYDYLPKDYTMTDNDVCAQIAIESSLPTDILVKIDDIFVKQEQLLCLLDPSKCLDDDVISAYICCMKDQEHLRSKNNFNVYFENPFISGLLKRDGELGVDGNSKFLTNIVRNYLKHEMILIPINFKNVHWYLAIINAKKREIQVLDSLCWDFNRADLTTTLKGLQYHLNIVGKEQNLDTHSWKDICITKWMVTEQLQEPMQKDSSSCGLFMLKFMEYWTGDTLSHHISQEDIIDFRYKLAGILLCWKINTTGMISKSEQSHGTEENCKDLIILKSSDAEKEIKVSYPLSEEMKYQTLMSVVSKMGVHELVAGLCNYIKSINCAETLEKVWVRNSKPYSISLTLKKLQEILKEDQPMDRESFNLVIRKLMFDNSQMVKKTKQTISKHYLEMQFWVLTDFGRHPNFRKKLDEDQLAESFRSWPGSNYNVSKCKSILMPIQFHGAYILVILDKDTRTVYILDPTPLDPIYQYNPNARYVKEILWIAEYLPKAMAKACPGSRWNENIFLWRQIILPGVPIHSKELSGHLVCLFMSTWKDAELQLPIIKDGYEIRKQIVAQLLTYKANECEDNIPAGVQDLIACINNPRS